MLVTYCNHSLTIFNNQPLIYDQLAAWISHWTFPQVAPTLGLESSGPMLGKQVAELKDLLAERGLKKTGLKAGKAARQLVVEASWDPMVWKKSSKRGIGEHPSRYSYIYIIYMLFFSWRITRARILHTSISNKRVYTTIIFAAWVFIMYELGMPVDPTV